MLICSDKGHVQIARRASLRWHDDAGKVIAVPRWWMPLPEPPAKEQAKAEIKVGAKPRADKKKPR
jgi:hypothetical protein